MSSIRISLLLTPVASASHCVLAVLPIATMSRSFVPAVPEQVEDPDAPQSRTIVSHARSHSVAEYVIYGPELSYFTRKLHAAVHWAHLPYRWLPKHAQILAGFQSDSPWVPPGFQVH